MVLGPQSERKVEGVTLVDREVTIDRKHRSSLVLGPHVIETSIATMVTSMATKFARFM
jgi:hypothetical protein